MTEDQLARIHLPPHSRVNLKGFIKTRTAELGISPTDIDCPLAENADAQPTIQEMVALAVKLRCVLEFTDARLVRLDNTNAHE
jgi:hypothetical protein